MERRRIYVRYDLTYMETYSSLNKAGVNQRLTLNTKDSDFVNAGWSLFPVAVIPGSSTFTMNFTVGKFDADLFAMANKTEYKTNSNYALDTAERHEPDANHQIELLQTPIEGSIYIANLEPITTQSGTVTSGHYLINGKKITFSADDDIDYVDVVYQYTKEVSEAIVTNKESAIGECSCIWPVYGSGDDCTESSIVGYYIVKVFRARITTIPGMDTSLATLREAAQ